MGALRSNSAHPFRFHSKGSMSVKKNSSDEALSRSRQKRLDMNTPANQSKLYHEPGTVDGSELPSSSDGWVLGQPSSDPDLMCVAVKSVRLQDGQHIRFYRMMTRPEVVKKLRKRAKNKMREIERQQREEAKKSVKKFLASIGKS